MIRACDAKKKKNGKMKMRTGGKEEEVGRGEGKEEGEEEKEEDKKEEDK